MNEVSVELGEQEKPFPHNYRQLRGDKQEVDGKIGVWSTEYLLSEYASLTDGLIGRLDGTIPIRGADVIKVTPEGIRKEKQNLPSPSSVIYLDKSARPVRWLVDGLWDVLAREPGTNY